MKPRTILTVLVSLLLAMLVAWATNQWLEERLTAAAKSVESVRAVAAVRDIPVGSAISFTDIKLVDLPPEAAPADGYDNMEALVGSVVMQGIYAGEIVVKRRVEEDVSGSRLAILISEGMRAMTVRVNDVTGVSGFLLPGSRVDLLEVSRKEGAKTILEDLKILAVGQLIETKDKGAVSVRAVTLEVDPRQAEIVASAGNVRLTLRNPVDRERVEPPKERVAMAESLPTRPDLFAIDVIRGVKLSTTTVHE